MHLAVRPRVARLAEVSIRRASNLRWLLARVVSSVQFTELAILRTSVSDRSRISVVRVDTSKNTSTGTHNTVDDDMARATVGLAVSAGAVELAVGVGEEILD